MKVSGWGGMTREEHDALQHTSAMIAENAITVPKIAFPVFEVMQDRLYYTSGNKNIAVFASSKSNVDDIFVCELHASSGSVLFKRHTESLLLNATKTIVNPVANESNIYDGNPNTEAYPSSNLNPGETREMIRWDLGTSAERMVVVRMIAYHSYEGVKIDISNDETTWTTLFNVYSTGGAWEKYTFSTATFRYLRWVCYNNSSSSNPGSDFKLCELQVFPPEMQSYNTFPRIMRATTRNEGICFCYSGDSALVLGFYLFKKIQ